MSGPFHAVFYFKKKISFHTSVAISTSKIVEYQELGKAFDCSETVEQ